MAFFDYVKLLKQNKDQVGIGEAYTDKDVLRGELRPFYAQPKRFLVLGETASVQEFAKSVEDFPLGYFDLTRTRPC